MEILRRSSILLLLPILLLVMAGCEDDTALNVEDDPNPVKSPGKTVDGEVAGPWSGTYTLTGETTVPEGETLIIQPGTKIYAHPGASLNVYGAIEAKGDPEAMITFTSARTFPDRGDWDGIRIINSDLTSMFEYVQVSYAAKYDIRTDTTRNRDNPVVIPASLVYRGAISVQNSSPTIRRSIIDFGGYDGIQLIGDCNATIEHNTIVNNAFNGIRVEPDWSLSYDQIFSQVGASTIENNIIVENDDAGIRLHEDETFYVNGIPTIRYNNIWNNASLDYVPPSFRAEANVSTDIHVNPVFVDVVEGDYDLHPCSGVIDKGEPTMTDPDGTRLDIGALYLRQTEFDLAKNLVDNIYINGTPGESGTLQLQAGETYYVRCDAFVPENSTLNIPAGTTLMFEGPYSLYINGTIKAGDRNRQPILFTSALEPPQRGDWRQLVFDHANGGSYLENAVVEYASMDDRSVPEPDTLGAISIIASSPSLYDVTIRDCYYAGLHTRDGARPTIERLTVQNVGLHGVVAELNSSPTLSKITIHDVLGYGMHLRGNSSAVVNNVLMYNLGSAGFLVEDLSFPEINYATVYGEYSTFIGTEEPVTRRINIGMRVNASSPTVRNSIISQYGMVGVQSQVSSRPSLSNVFLYSSVGADATSGNVITANVFTEDPQFVNPEEGIFQLRAGSPAMTAADDGGQVGAFGGNGM